MGELELLISRKIFPTGVSVFWVRDSLILLAVVRSYGRWSDALAHS